MAVDVDPRVGTSLAGYRLEEQVSHGGMGVVYRAHDAALDRSVAVKLVASRLGGDHDFRDRFLVEARLAASLDHPNVVPVHDAGDIDGQLYLAMRYVEGTDLRDLLAEEGQLDPERALAICGQVAAALDVAHERGLLHRDVKPSNVLLDEREHAYLADFGLTRRLTDAAPEFDAGLSLGTPAYVAPEQIEGKRTGPAADQYSLACMLYECLTGEPPYRRGSEAATLYAHLEDDPPYYPRLEHVFARALAKNPEERFESCTAVVDAARQALPRTRSRRRLLAAAAAVAVLAAAAVAAALALTRDDGPTVGDVWSQVPHNEAAFGGTQKTNPKAIVVGDSKLIAVGQSSAEPEYGDSDVRIWSSPDGVSWTLNAVESFAAPGWQYPNAAIASPSGYVVVGTEVLEFPENENDEIDGAAAVWHSRDGTEWDRIPHDERVFGGRNWQIMWDVVVGGPGLVAVGGDGGHTRQAAVWTSPDGERWTRVPPDPRVFGSPTPKNWYMQMSGAAVAEGGRIVAVGLDAWEHSTAAVWTSSDGLSWARAPHDDELFGDRSTDVEATTVTAGGSGFVAAIVEMDGGPELYAEGVLRVKGPTETRSRIILSSDGLAWTAVPTEQLPDGGVGVYIYDMTRGGPGFVAAGWRRNNPGVADADVDPVVWISADGENWAEAADPEGVFSQPGGQLIQRVVAGGPGLVAIGHDGSVDGFNTAIWTSP